MNKKIVIVGFGNLGQAILPLLQQDFQGYRIVAFEKEVDAERTAIATESGVDLRQVYIERENYHSALGSVLEYDDYLLNLAVEVSTVDLIELAQECGAFYLDAGIEPWAYESAEGGITTSNYELREHVIARAANSRGKKTAVVAQGANPGFVSTLVKCALEKMGRLYLPDFTLATGNNDVMWAKLAEQLGIRVVQISECDTQVSHRQALPGEFVNTWSVDGLITEALQPAELGRGSHERSLPPLAMQHESGCKAAIMLNCPVANVQVRSWSPNRLEYEGFLITHNEAISIANFLTVQGTDGGVRYRPTVYYAYRPCDETVQAMQLISDGTTDAVKARRVVKEEVISGIDELGVFMLSDRYPSTWLGSNLSIGRTRAIAKYNNATSLQVVSSIVGAMLWMLKHPLRGIVEAEQLDHQFMYEYTAPYWGPMVYERTTWRPSDNEHNLQFESFLVKAENVAF